MSTRKKLPIVLFVLIFIAQSVLTGSGLSAGVNGSGQMANVHSSVYGPGTSVNDAVYESVYGPAGMKPALTFEQTEIKDNILTNFEMEFGDGTPLPDPPETLPNPAETELEMSVRYEFALPDDHTYGAGSTYTFKLPEQLEVYNVVSGTLGNYGGYTVDRNGTVVLTFNENIESDSEIEGWFEFRSYIARGLEGSTEQTIRVPIEGDTYVDIPLLFEVKGNSIDKRGTPNQYYNGTKITWEVDFNKDRAELVNAELHDPIDGNQKFVDGSIKIYELDVRLDGTVTQGNDVTSSFDTNEFPINFGDTNGAYRVVFETDITDEDGTSYPNKATLTADGVDLDATSTVWIQRGKALEKRAASYDPVSQTITWEIKYNYN